MVTGNSSQRTPAAPLGRGMPVTTPAEVIGFWRDAGPARWFRADPDFDRQCRVRFLDAHLAAAQRELDGWLADAAGALALLLLLDQIPRNVYRGSAHAYATDPLARRFATQAIAAGHDQACAPDLRAFFYMPFEHSEEPADQARAVALFEALGDASYLHYAHAHRDAIARFGRFPHRNAALGRDSTPEEQAWLDAGGGW
jgi:uncharacterized protein (DUF924 family)